METKYHELASLISYQARNHHKPRYLVAIAGIPGSGKTTAAKEMARILNEDLGQKTALISMDGFHLPRAALDQLPDPGLAHARRGAPWTFNLPRFLCFARRLRAWADRTPLSCSYSGIRSTQDILTVPTFDHEVKDPVEDGFAITPETAVLIVEGSYLLLDEPGWNDVTDLFDYRVFIDADLQKARTRVAKRHVSAGIEKNLVDGLQRADSNDYLNGVLILSKLLKPDTVLKNI